MFREPTLEKLNALRLRVMASTWLEQDKSPDTIALPFDERLAMLVDAEMLARENARLTKNLRDAKLRMAEACIEGLDLPKTRELDKAVVRTLATCRWVTEHQTVIITGATGRLAGLVQWAVRDPFSLANSVRCASPASDIALQGRRARRHVHQR